jgi:hypothetical protein
MQGNDIMTKLKTQENSWKNSIFPATDHFREISPWFSECLEREAEVSVDQKKAVISNVALFSGI